MRGTLEERFWKKVERSDSCWEWTGARDQKGYGALVWAGRVHGSHRIAWELTNGPITDGLHVLHRCDNPPCVRPDHLFLGTHRDNMRDRDRKGRLVNLRGEQHPQARLTDAQVAEVRARRAAGATTVALAAEYGVGQKNISDICLGKRRAPAPEAQR